MCLWQSNKWHYVQDDAQSQTCNMPILHTAVYRHIGREKIVLSAGEFFTRVSSTVDEACIQTSANGHRFILVFCSLLYTSNTRQWGLSAAMCVCVKHQKHLQRHAHTRNTEIRFTAVHVRSFQPYSIKIYVFANMIKWFIIQTEWPHRQCVGLALRKSHVRGSLDQCSKSCDLQPSPHCSVQHVELRGYCPV